jgi:hypothetical protein
MFRAYGGIEGRKNKNKKIVKCNTKQNTTSNKLFFFQKAEFHYKPACKEGNM